MRVSLIANLYRPDAVEAARRAADWLKERGHEAIADRESGPALGLESRPGEDLASSDLMVCFGGDGTLLRAANIVGPTGIPILGVYYGQFGFVTQCRPDDVVPALEEFLAGKSQIEDRMMVRTELIRSGRTVTDLHSLNEAVVQRSPTSRMLTFDVSINDTLVARYPADGVLVATPTGSTAYSLSAGGPIIEPSLAAILVTAVMPHTLSSRPLVLPADSRVEIRIETRGDAVLSCDGHSRLHLLSGDTVQVTRSERVTRLIKVGQIDFLEKLSRGLGWSSRGKVS